MSQEEKLPKILIVEDDERLARLTQEYLIRNGLEVGVETDGNRAIRRIISEQPDLVVLDVMLPGADGLTVCREVRPHYHQPILMLTARTEDMDQVLGLEMGADDYVTKPFSMSVLISKISAMLKRTEKTISNVVQTGELTFYINEKRVTKGNDIISITPTDWKLLMAFIEHPRHILSRNQLLESLWDVNSDYVDENAVAVNIRRLREKIEPDPSNPVYIKNVRGLGYVWEMRCERQ